MGAGVKFPFTILFRFRSDRALKIPKRQKLSFAQSYLSENHHLGSQSAYWKPGEVICHVENEGFPRRPNVTNVTRDLGT